MIFRRNSPDSLKTKPQGSLRQLGFGVCLGLATGPQRWPYTSNSTLVASTGLIFTGTTVPG